MKRSILTTVMLLAASALSLLPAESATAATPVDVRVGSLSGIKAATGTPDGLGVFAALAGTSTTTPGRLYDTATAGSVPLNGPGAPVLVAAAPVGAHDAAVLVVRAGSPSWDLVPSWDAAAPSGSPAAAPVVLPPGLSGTPVAAVAAGSYAYVELSSGTFVAVNLTSGTATSFALPTGTPSVALVGTTATNKKGVLAISDDGGTLYVGTSTGALGTVQRVSVSGGAIGSTSEIALTAGTPTALLVDGASLYAASTFGIGVADAASVTEVPLASYPAAAMSCGSLAIDTHPLNPTEHYLDCAPTPGSTSLLVYRFTVPSDPADGLRVARGSTLTKTATGVWGVAAPIGGILVLEGDTVWSVSIDKLSSAVAPRTFPQPPVNVTAAPACTTSNGATCTGSGIWVAWEPPAVAADEVIGYLATATPASGGVSTCVIWLPAANECRIAGGLTPGTPYTVSVQSLSGPNRTDTQRSASVPAPYKVNAGTPGPTITNPSGGASCATSTGNAGIVVPTYTVAKSSTPAAPAVTLTWPTVTGQTCDPFTHAANSMGANAVSYYVITAVDAATNMVAKTVPVPSSSTSYTLTGLGAGKSYVFSVAANNAPSAYAANWTGAATYAVPATSTGSGAGAPASSTVMEPAVSADGSASSATYVPGGTWAGAWAAAYRSQADLYQSALYAYNGENPMDPSIVASAPTAPHTIDVVGNSAAIVVKWQAQANYGHAASTTQPLGWGRQDVVGYTASASTTSATGVVTTKTCATTIYTLTTCTITGLTNGTAYTVSVQAKSGALGPAAYFTDGVSGGAPVTVTPAGMPMAPTAVTATVPAISPNAASQQWGTAVVKWTPPTDNGGLPITGYQIVATPADTSVANPLTEYLCDPHDLTSPSAQTLINAQIAATPALAAPEPGNPSALPISVSAIDSSHLFPDQCSSLPTNKWGTSYTFPVGSLSSQTTWSFRVAAHNAYDAAGSTTATWGALSTASAKISPTGAPMPPTKVITTMSGSGITATWTAPTTIGGWALKGYQANLYRYDSVGNATWINRCTASAAQTSCSVPNVSQTPDGASYFFTVQATNNGYGQPSRFGTLPASNESAVSNTLAWYAKPPALTVIDATPGDKTISVGWDPNPHGGSLDSSNSPITLYTASATSGTTTKTCTALPPATSCLITGLTNGAAYTVGITEANPGLSSLPGYWKDPKDLTSSPTTAVSPGTVPDAPTAVTARPGNLGADVWWTAPKNTGGVRIDYYTVSVVPGGAQCPSVAGNGPLTCHLDGLTNGIDYTATVVAHNWFGDSSASVPSAAFKPYGVSTPPLNVQAAPEDARATITWEAPIDTGGAAITSYEAVARPIRSGAGALRSCKSLAPVTAATKTTPAIIGQAPMTCVITGLTNGAEYTVDVVAVNLAGTSLRSGPTAPFIPVGAPDAPTGVFAYTDIGGSTQGPTTLHVAWNPSQNTGGSEIVRYTARASNGSSCVAEAGLTACDIDDLRAGVKYTVTVTATNLDGFVSKPSAASPPSVPAGPPSVPTDVIATGAQNAITVTWKASRGNGAAITQYVVTVQPTGQVLLVAGTRTSAVISNLDAALSYQVTVQAQSGPVLVSGLSKRSNLARPYNTPNRIERPIAKAVKQKHGYKALIGWKAPIAGGAPVTGYLVSRAGGPSRTVGASVLQTVFKGLKANKRYSFTVTPINKYGRGLTSLPVVVKTRA